MRESSAFREHKILRDGDHPHYTIGFRDAEEAYSRRDDDDDDKQLPFAGVMLYPPGACPNLRLGP